MQKTELKFNSQVCTTKIQSQRLLELGLKAETADMYYAEGSEDAEGDIEYHLRIRREWEDLLRFNDIPAWSLHRLLCMLYTCEDVYPIMPTTAYDDIIDEIETEIECGGFNKEYLRQ
jgi:hypothetical protein